MDINAIHEDDLQVYLDKNGYKEKIARGEIKCPCGETITMENIDAMQKIDGELVFYHSIICTS